MKGLQYSTHDTLEGPWLLEANALKNLDAILSKHWELLESRREQFLDLAVDDEYKKYELQFINSSAEDVREKLEIFRRSHPVYSISYFQIYIHYKKSRYFCKKFESAFRERSLLDSVPIGFVVEFNSAEIKCKLDLEEDNGLSISITPEDCVESQNLFLDIYEWAIGHRAAYWQRLWGRIANRGFVPYLGTFILLGIIFLVMNFTQDNSDILKAQTTAQELIDKGIDNSNIAEAVRLLLQMQVVGQTTIEFPNWFRVILIICTIIGLVIPFRPRVVLGIGRGQSYLRLWKLWLTAVGITLPSFAIYNFVLPPIIDFIKQIINSP
jgi:hypothetical protein